MIELIIIFIAIVILFFLNQYFVRKNRKHELNTSVEIEVDMAVSAGRSNYKYTPRTFKVSQKFFEKIKENKAVLIKGVSMSPLGIKKGSIVLIEPISNIEQLTPGNIIMLDYSHKYPDKKKLREFKKYDNGKINSYTYGLLGKQESVHEKATLEGKVIAFTRPIA